MAEYIERKAVLRAYEEEQRRRGPWRFEKLIASIPAEDVAPVRHGRWIESPRLYYGTKQYECSLCYSDTFWKKHSITEKYPHCPNCGATMYLED